MPISMMAPFNVSRSTIAVKSRWLVKVFVHPEKDSLLATAIKFFSSRSVRTGNSSSASRHLSVSQPSSSMQEQDLDKFMGLVRIAIDPSGHH